MVLKSPGNDCNVFDIRDWGTMYNANKIFPVCVNENPSRK